MFSWQVEIGGGVGGYDAGAAEPGEEAADAAEPGKLGVGDQRLSAARTAVMVEEKLVGFEIGAGEGGGIVCAERVRPCGELPQRPAVGVDGWLGVRACSKVGQKGLCMCCDALVCDCLRGGCAAFAASAHSGKIRKSGLAWHGDGVFRTRMRWQRRDNLK